MNIRKLLDWRKALLYSHRWLGIAFGLLFVSWFVSGIAFMYWGMPAFTAHERLAHQNVIDLSKATVSPLEAAQAHNIRPGNVQITMDGDRPVYNFGSDAVYADTGGIVPVKTAGREQAVELIRQWVPEHAPTVRYDAYLEDSDQWTLQSAQRNQMPLHRIAVGDEADTKYYVAENNSRIMMKTDREARIKGFLSGVLHWVYFVPLRKHTYAWNQFIVWGSFAGAVMCLTGVIAGVWRLSLKGRFRQKGQRSHSPYSGLMRWHHYSGLLFGFVSFTWILSGAFSVNPFDMFSQDGGLTRDQHEVLTGGPIKLEAATVDALRTGVAAIHQHFPAKEIDIQQFRGRLYLTADPPMDGDAGGQQALPGHQMVWLDDPYAGTFTKFDNAAIEQIAAEAMVGLPVQDQTWLHEYDNYYRSRDNSRPLPVLRVRYLDERKTWLYLDPHRGTMTQQGSRARLNRWLYAALHELDLPFLYNRRPLWDIVVILLSIGGILLSGTTLWPMFKRLARHGRRIVRLPRRPEKLRQPDRISAD